MKTNMRNILKWVMFIALPTILIWLAFVANSQYYEKKYTLDRMVEFFEIRDSNTSLLIDSYMQEIIENLKVIRDADELKAYLNDSNSQTYSELEGLFMRIMSNKSNYAQLRLVDASGDEIIRAENSGKTSLIPIEDMQNIKDRYYFKETMKLQKDAFYISPLDLNEDGIIQTPYLPVLRFACPLYDESHALKGMLIINYRAEHVLNVIAEQRLQTGTLPVDFYVLNSNGEYIINPDEEMNEAAMFENNKDQTFAQTFPEVWEDINTHAMGHIVAGDSFVSYYDVLTDTKVTINGYHERWIVIHRADISGLFSVSSMVKEMLFSKSVIVLFAIFFFSLTIAIFIERVRTKDSQLQIAMSIAEMTQEAVIITDEKTNITYVNKAYEESTGYSASEVLGKRPSDFKSGRHGEEFYKKMWRSIRKTGQWEGLLWDKRKDGLLYPKKLRIIASRSHYIGIFTDLTSNKRKTDMLHTMNYNEGQIVLPNEEVMIDLLKQTIEHDHFNFMILYIAIDNFNQLLTTFDQEAFNSSEEFIRLVKPLIHVNDFVAQTGRNLFAVIMDLQHLPIGPQEYVAKMHDELSKIIMINGREVFFKTRIGVSFWPEDTRDLKRLLLNSIIALDWTSTRQDSEIAFYSENMLQQLSQENQIESYLRNAIEKNELYVVYQPQTDIRTGKMVGMEALLRWENEVLGFVSPAIFIPMAEKSRLIIEIGRWVIEQVCKDISEMYAECHLTREKLRCAINLSSIQMEEGRFVDDLENILTSYGIGGQQIEMEITESTILRDEHRKLDTIQRIRDLGISIALDDFGTGYSSLSYLNSLPIDKIKIDRSFIKNYPETDDGNLAKILVDMSKSLGIEVLTEGTETFEQIAYLKSIGCNKVQGYYYSKPLKLNDFISYVKANI